MLASSIPTKIPLAFASSGAKNTIPSASQIAVTPGAASLTDGFPPLTMTPLAAGGIAPAGQDMNGILNLISGAAVWYWTGGAVVWDSTFSASVGGYPQGATVVQAANPLAKWVSLVDNNTTDPDTGGAGWVGSYPAFTQEIVLLSSGTFTVPLGVYRPKVRMWGAGGSGGGCVNYSYAGGGGGAGGYSEGYIAVTPGQVISYTVGQGMAGAVGGTTSFLGMSATGGAVGGNGTSTTGGVGGAGGQGSGGTLNLIGGGGSLMLLFSSGQIEGGRGGAAPSGVGHSFASGSTATGFAANPGTFPGGGSSGCTGSTAPGGSGLVIVEC